jgi:hypothetical protein
MIEETNGFATGYAVGRDATGNGGYGNNGFFGNDWAWIVILLLFGYGRGFGGFGGGYGSTGGVGENYVLATDFATIERKLDGVNNGLCDGFYAQNTNMLNGFAGVQQTLCQGFSGIDRSIANLGYQQAQCCCDIKGEIKDVAYGNAMNTNQLDRRISDCCCETQRAIDSIRYENAKNTCDILRANQDNTRAIIDYLANEKAQALRDENFALRLSASQAKQNEYLIARLGDKCPEPAYIVQPPQHVTFPTNCCGTVNYASNGCGCGSF